jgi:hypothetical protein
MLELAKAAVAFNTASFYLLLRIFTSAPTHRQVWQTSTPKYSKAWWFSHSGGLKANRLALAWLKPGA